MAPRSVRVRSLAKINLDLRVYGKRPDGFHELRTVFQTISLADTIGIEYTPGHRSAIEIEDSAAIPDNLVVRAAQALIDRAKIRGAIRFRLDKRIPMGAGLGGGSSNAAAVLLSLPVLAGKHVAIDTLSAIGADLGSDVPFFLHGGAALGFGRGTELYPLDDIRSTGLLLAPEIHVSTAEAYRALERGPLWCNGTLTTARSPLDTRSFESFAWAVTESGDGWRALCANDFESAVFRLHPQLATLRRKLRKLGATPAMMTGSGSALFGLFASREQVRQAGEAFPNVATHQFELIGRKRYRALWRRQLQPHILSGNQWPPQSRYAQ